MANIKVLPLERWMLGELDEKFTSIDPVFNRNGYYCLGRKCWFEVNGNAYQYEKKYFDYALRLYNHSPLRDKEMKALEILLKEKILDKKMKELLTTEKYWRSQRSTKRNIKLFMIKYNT